MRLHFVLSKHKLESNAHRVADTLDIHDDSVATVYSNQDIDINGDMATEQSISIYPDKSHSIERCQ